MISIGGSRGRARRTPPVRVQILLFRQTKFSKHNRVRSWRPTRNPGSTTGQPSMLQPWPWIVTFQWTVTQKLDHGCSTSVIGRELALVWQSVMLNMWCNEEKPKNGLVYLAVIIVNQPRLGIVCPVGIVYQAGIVCQLGIVCPVALADLVGARPVHTPPMGPDSFILTCKIFKT